MRPAHGDRLTIQSAEATLCNNAHETPRNDAKPKRYPSDLTRTQWKRLKRLLPEAKPGGRPRIRRPPRGPQRHLLHHPRRMRLADDAHGPAPLEHLLRLLPQVAQRRHLGEGQRRPADPGPPQGTGGKKSPSMGIIDSQSVKTTEQGGPHGKDAHKKVNGRKRHLVVDTLGMVVAAVVHSAGIQDRDGAKLGPEEDGRDGSLG